MRWCCHVTTHQQAHKDYLSGMKYKEIAEKYGVSLATVKSWKTRYGWSRDKTKKSMHTKDKSMHTKKRGAPIGNHNALYNSGGAPVRNSNAVKHGLLAKYLPEETLEIVMDVDDAGPIDILWANIKIQFAKILRSQNIMYVQSARDDKIITKKGRKERFSSEQRSIEEYSEQEEIIVAEERQAAFIKAQSLAMATLTKMIQQYDVMCRSPLATDEQRARIDKIRAEVANISMGNRTIDVNVNHNPLAGLSTEEIRKVIEKEDR